MTQNKTTQKRDAPFSARLRPHLTGRLALGALSVTTVFVVYIGLTNLPGNNPALLPPISDIVGSFFTNLQNGSLLTALLLVFVDVLKELPATLMLRPFNYNTLAVRAFEMASDERLAEAAPASLAIVIAGIVPVILLSRSITASRRSH